MTRGIKQVSKASKNSSASAVYKKPLATAGAVKGVKAPTTKIARPTGIASKSSATAGVKKAAPIKAATRPTKAKPKTKWY